jgi:hypothetical protein
MKERELTIEQELACAEGCGMFLGEWLACQHETWFDRLMAWVCRKIS